MKFLPHWHHDVGTGGSFDGGKPDVEVPIDAEEKVGGQTTVYLTGAFVEA